MISIRVNSRHVRDGKMHRKDGLWVPEECRDRHLQNKCSIWWDKIGEAPEEQDKILVSDLQRDVDCATASRRDIKL